jgi:hypothetical protein
MPRPPPPIIDDHTGVPHGSPDTLSGRGPWDIAVGSLEID